MANLRKTFVSGRMAKDSDERLIQEGLYRHAENILVLDSEGSDVGTVQNSFSNKKLTNINFGGSGGGGGNSICIGAYSDEPEDKIYWFVVSDYGCYLIEYDFINKVSTIVLADTRIGSNRVLKLDKNFLITGIEKIISEDTNKDLLLWTDDNMEPCCINIERAKTWSENGFELEDILLIKKPPRYAPKLTPVYISGGANNIEEKLLSFSYRYKYLDGEYSALSSYTNYSFTPKDFKLDYYILQNQGMVNAFNGVKIEINTGDKRVTHIQLVVKESNSNNLIVVETFNKKNEGWGDNLPKSYQFSNSKLHSSLPSKELYRAYDNVPLRAKALTLIGNRPIFGNYLEGRDLIDYKNEKVYLNYELSLIQQQLEDGSDFTNVIANNTFTFSNPDEIELKEQNKITFNIVLKIAGADSYNGSFFYLLPQDYNTIAGAFDTDLFRDFLKIVEADLQQNYLYDTTPTTPINKTGYVEFIKPTIVSSISGNDVVLTVTPVTFKDNNNADALVVEDITFDPLSTVVISSFLTSASLKTEKDYEAGFLYMDTMNRATTVLTTPYNTIFIPLKYSIFKNKIRVKINSIPPAWADRFKIVVKSKPLVYEVIYINKFYNEDLNVWCKLEGDNKDKVKVGDTLLLKKSPAGAETSVQKVDVLEIKVQGKDFIPLNADQEEQLIIEEQGLYMKIRPSGFSMDVDDYEVKQSADIGSEGGNDSFPKAYLDLFSAIDGLLTVDYAVPVGSSITLKLDSSFNYKDGWKHHIHEKEYFTQRNYNSIGDWVNEVLVNKYVPAIVNEDASVITNYGPNISLVRGKIIKFLNAEIFRESGLATDKLYLKVIGLESGGTKGRYGRIDAKLVIRSSSGFYAFETVPKQAETEIYYETEQTFDIIANNHQGNIQNQQIASRTAAVIELDAFNCFAQGNGVESYKIKDGFNKNYLNIDLRPSASSFEEYKAIRRYADLTYGESYVESSNINGLNEFNLSTANYKELDKQYGSIQKLHSRDNDILVLQEEKASKVYFEKEEVKNADGSSSLVTMDKVLGNIVTYLGENGIGKNPESFAVNDYQIFYANPRRGLIQRLSIDGVTEIVEGMVDFFRDLFTSNPNSKKIGSYDPYLNQYVLSTENEAVAIYNIECGNTIVKENQNTPFTYTLNLNDLEGNIILNYNITVGNATITGTINGSVSVVSNVTGIGTLTIPRNALNANSLLVAIIPISQVISFEITNICPVGIPMKVVSIVQNDGGDIGKSIINRYRWGTSPFYAETDIFDAQPVSRFSAENGIEGIGRMPKRGSIINLQSFKDASSTGSFKADELDRLGYLVSNTVYTEADIETINSLATFIPVTEELDGFLTVTNAANFLFNRSASNEILYLIWDYTNRVPVINCLLSEWSAWSTCTNGTRTRTRTVLTPASGGGTVCGPLTETESCFPDPIPCNSLVTSGGSGISDYFITLDNPSGGVVTFDFNAQGVPDKLEIIHMLPSDVFVKKATSSMNASNNSGPFDDVYGTRTSNVVPSGNVGSINQFIGSNKGAVPNRYNEYVAATGITNLPFTSGMQQRVWWVYSAGDYTNSNQVNIRVTGDQGTAWNLTRLCPVS